MTPRMVRQEDVEEQALAEVDQRFMDYFGPDFAHWQPWQQENYLTEIDKVHAEFAPEAVAA